MYFIYILSFLFFLLCLPFSNCLNEFELRNVLFKNYNINNRPVKNISNNVILEFGLEIVNLVYFNQKSENIEITMKNTLSWRDEYLVWNKSKENPIYITSKTSYIWQPDIELYNAASKPKIYDKNPIVKIYYNGTIEQTRYISYSFACKLKLEKFPYDIQTCSMLFGSWKYPKSILDIKPFVNNKFKNFSISEKFSHNEWNIIDIDINHQDNEYKCCPGDLWPNSLYIITLKRNPHKYNVMIIMSIFIVLSSLCISILSIDNYTRSYILVFIPLTLIWLQIHTSSKIPVIENGTTLESIIMSCFFTTIILAFESGIFYCILKNYNRILSKHYLINKKELVYLDKYIKELRPIKNINIELENLNYDIFLKTIKKIDKKVKLIMLLIFNVSLVYFLI